MAAALLCVHHRDTRAELECKPCRAVLCRDCARPLRDGRTFVCLACGAMLLPIMSGQVHVPSFHGPISRAARDVDAAQPLLARLPRTLGYLFRPSVLVTLAGMAFLELLASIMGLFMQFVVAGLLAGVFFHIVETTANDATELEPPDFSDFWGSVLAPLLRMLTTLVPLFVAVALAGLSVFEAMTVGPRDWMTGSMGVATVILAMWLFLWPLLILVAAIARSLVATVNPKVWLDVLRQMRGDYLLAAFAFYVVLAAELFIVTPLVWRVEASVHVPFVTSYLANLIVLLPVAWRARILGEAARPYLD